MEIVTEEIYTLRLTAAEVKAIVDFFEERLTTVQSNSTVDELWNALSDVYPAN